MNRKTLRKLRRMVRETQARAARSLPPDVAPPTACPCAEWVKFGACPHTQRGAR